MMEAVQNLSTLGPNKIIGICGLAGSGKDTFADFLCKFGDFSKLAFADPIKRAAMEWYDFSEQQLWGPSHFRNLPDDRYPILDINHPIYDDLTEEDKLEIFKSENRSWVRCLSPRFVLQNLGTEVGRRILKSTWVDKTIRDCHTLLHSRNTEYIKTEGIVKAENKFSSRCIITDVRFQNEVDTIRKNNGIVVKITKQAAGLDGKYSAHESEAGVKDIDNSLFFCTIENNGTLEDLKQKADNLVASI